MSIAARLDDHGRPAWIALLVVTFILFWPAGLALLAYMIWSGRMSCHAYGYNNCGRHGRWHRYGDEGRDSPERRAFEEARDKFREAGQHLHEAAHEWRRRRRHRHHPETSGNRAFDEYRAETLRRLEEEQRDFHDFLDRLRFAKDKAEFDEFLTERRRRAEQPPADPREAGPSRDPDHPRYD